MFEDLRQLLETVLEDVFHGWHGWDHVPADQELGGSK